MSSSRNPTLGIRLVVAAVAALAAQDGFSRHLAAACSTQMIVMIPYWIFATFVILLAPWRAQGLHAAIRSTRAPAHLVRSVFPVAGTCLIVVGAGPCTLSLERKPA